MKAASGSNAAEQDARGAKDAAQDARGGKDARPPRPDFSPVVPSVGDTKTKVIGGIQFGMMPGSDMMKLAHVPICSRELYRLPSRQPAAFGVLDPRLGISDKSSVCGTCKCRLAECAGHWGVVQLELPVYHVGFLKATLAALQSICKTCSRVLLAYEERKAMCKLMRDPATDPLRKARLRRKIQDMVKKQTSCPYCGAINGVVKKVNGATCFRIIHDRYRGIRQPGEEAGRRAPPRYTRGAALVPTLAARASTEHVELTPAQTFRPPPFSHLQAPWRRKLSSPSSLSPRQRQNPVWPPTSPALLTRSTPCAPGSCSPPFLTATWTCCGWTGRGDGRRA